MFEHPPSQHGIQLVWNSVGHVGMDIVVQQDDAIGEFTVAFVRGLGMQLFSSHYSETSIHRFSGERKIRTIHTGNVSTGKP
jgi:hypothetical protein